MRISLKVEGLIEKNGLPFNVKPDATILEAINQVVSEKQGDYEQLNKYFYDRAGNICIYAVLVNDKMVGLKDFGRYILKDNDEIILILPVAGG